VNEGLVSLNMDAELASDTGHEHGLPALMHQMFSTTLRALAVNPRLSSGHNLIH